MIPSSGDLEHSHNSSFGTDSRNIRSPAFCFPPPFHSFSLSTTLPYSFPSPPTPPPTHTRLSKDGRGMHAVAAAAHPFRSDMMQAANSPHNSVSQGDLELLDVLTSMPSSFPHQPTLQLAPNQSRFLRSMLSVDHPSTPWSWPQSKLWPPRHSTPFPPLIRRPVPW